MTDSYFKKKFFQRKIKKSYSIININNSITNVDKTLVKPPA